MPGCGEAGRGREAAQPDYGIIDAKPAGAATRSGDGALNLSGLRADDRSARRMEADVQRSVAAGARLSSLKPSMNGVDWAKERERYAPLLPYVADRYDLTYILGEMVGELSNSHTYVGGGDYPDLHPVNLGLLGADYELDAASGLYRFKKIYPGRKLGCRPALASHRARREGEGRRLPDRRQRPRAEGAADLPRAVRQHRRTRP